MQIQKKALRNTAPTAELRTAKDEKSSLRAINKYLSEVESSKGDIHTTFGSKKSVFANDKPDLVENYRRRLNLQPSEELQHSVFLQSKLSNVPCDTFKYYSQKQIEDIDKQAQISRLMKQVEQQRTIIQLQDELIRRLISKNQNRQPSFDKSAYEGQNIDKISGIFQRLTEARQILEFLNE